MIWQDFFLLPFQHITSILIWPCSIIFKILYVLKSKTLNSTDSKRYRSESEQKISKNEKNSRFIEVASFFSQISSWNRSSQIVQWVNISRSISKVAKFKISVIFQIMARGQQKIQAQQKAAEKAAKLKKAAGNSKADNLKTAQAGLKTACKICMVRKRGYFLIFMIWIDSGVKNGQKSFTSCWKQIDFRM